MITRYGLARGLLGTVVALILGVTLFPVSGADPERLTACLICGSRGAADAILNVMLFLPVGVALALLRRSWRYAAIAALLLSLGIELTQIVVPGRDPSWADLLFNTAGGALGHLATRFLPRSLALTQSTQTAFWVVALTATAGVFALTGYLARPDFPATPYYGQWATYLGAIPWYRFHILEASVAGQPVPPRRLPGSAEIREILGSRPQLDVLAVALPPVSPSRRVIGLYDGNLREIVRLASAGNDLVLSYRMGAAALRLDRPTFRFVDALRGIRTGESVRISVSGRWQRPCVVVNQLVTCARGLTLGSGWRYLLDVARLPIALLGVVNAAWLFALALPIGLWSTTDSRAALGAATVAAVLVLLPTPLSLEATPPLELTGGVLGVALGFAFRRGFKANSASAPAPVAQRTRLRG